MTDIGTMLGYIKATMVMLGVFDLFIVAFSVTLVLALVKMVTGLLRK